MGSIRLFEMEERGRRTRNKKKRGRRRIRKRQSRLPNPVLFSSCRVRQRWLPCYPETHPLSGAEVMMTRQAAAPTEKNNSERKREREQTIS